MQMMTVVISFPDAATAAKAAREAVPFGGEFHGGEVTAIYAGDAISENEIFEQNANPELIKAVREKVSGQAA